jgi:hypothetical protein
MPHGLTPSPPAVPQSGNPYYVEYLNVSMLYGQLTLSY